MVVLGKCLKIVGFIPSGPGDFLSLKRFSASLILSVDSQFSNRGWRSVLATCFCFWYEVAFRSTCWGKCVLIMMSWVSFPIRDVDPSGLVTDPICGQICSVRDFMCFAMCASSGMISLVCFLCLFLALLHRFLYLRNTFLKFTYSRSVLLLIYLRYKAVTSFVRSGIWGVHQGLFFIN